MVISDGICVFLFTAKVLLSSAAQFLGQRMYPFKLLDENTRMHAIGTNALVICVAAELIYLISMFDVEFRNFRLPNCTINSTVTVDD